ncbi:hypothetical protein [Streptomyces griseosporeus]|uniref:hypothetical protein n=1 Tax=Streptomyces griseosporeus TaxID=1910 RepID=UPI0019AD7D70|nr:hypothetical protein [Streptomyces griseosporeus]GHF81845.1 hypothetical protein GCM10018783_60160 [Streptomyces griseosporeus]
MSWTRGFLAALAVCVLLPAGPAGCGTGDAHEQHKGASPSPVGKLLDHTDEEGRRYREVDGEDAPAVRVEVQPATGGAWDVRLHLRHFRFSPPGAKAEAVAGRGTALLFVDGRPVAELHSPSHRLTADRLPHGTHQVTARLYADDDTVWAVHGDPVESTAAITASGAETAPSVSVRGAPVRMWGRGSPDPGGEAS